MKIDRLIGILSVLLQKDTVTAPELAELFEVSRRTTNRFAPLCCLSISKRMYYDCLVTLERLQSSHKQKNIFKVGQDYRFYTRERLLNED